MRRACEASRTVTLLAVLFLGGVLLSACALDADAALSAQDRAALAQLGAIAGPTSGVHEGSITGTECWLPSKHVLDESENSRATPGARSTTWNVLCRVGWIAEDGEQRFQDTTCIGNFAAEPMLDACYRWTHYDQMPAFEDAPSVAAR